MVEQKGPVRRRPRVEFAKAAPKPSGPRGCGRSDWSRAADATVVDEAYRGLRAGLKEAGLVDGRDFTINYRNAQGDIATLNSICDEMNGNDTDLVIAFTTTALQAALRKIDRKPLLFALVLDPFAAGAGKSDTDHRANVTGVYLAFPYAEVARAIREVLPRARRVGTLFTPGELNSVVARQRFEDALKKQGLSLESTPVNAPSEVSDAALDAVPVEDRRFLPALRRPDQRAASRRFPGRARARKPRCSRSPRVRSRSGRSCRLAPTTKTTAARRGCWPPR